MPQLARMQEDLLWRCVYCLFMNYPKLRLARRGSWKLYATQLFDNIFEKFCKTVLKLPGQL